MQRLLTDDDTDDEVFLGFKGTGLLLKQSPVQQRVAKESVENSSCDQFLCYCVHDQFKVWSKQTIPFRFTSALCTAAKNQ